MDRRPRKQAKTKTKIKTRKPTCSSEEVSSMEWEFIQMSDEEEDLINRMYRLVGDRWDLIAGRIPGRTAEIIERFWLMRQMKYFEEQRRERRHVLTSAQDE
ncbi:MYB-like transcription factor ETC3 [Impatiens glandulifera]|uniref:MYB-like transcription factor ETC3 n=1 Tax=Impatiens glandulifera TaxID=253017 RepID=UPI001FB1212B|nr:MYB-like transcription factor ETC3 [Impatiens glandulifera]